MAATTWLKPSSCSVSMGKKIDLLLSFSWLELGLLACILKWSYHGLISQEQFKAPSLTCFNQFRLRQLGLWNTQLIRLPYLTSAIRDVISTNKYFAFFIVENFKYKIRAKMASHPHAHSITTTHPHTHNYLCAYPKANTPICTSTCTSCCKAVPAILRLLPCWYFSNSQRIFLVLQCRREIMTLIFIGSVACLLQLKCESKKHVFSRTELSGNYWNYNSLGTLVWTEFAT